MQRLVRVGKFLPHIADYPRWGARGQQSRTLTTTRMRATSTADSVTLSLKYARKRRTEVDDSSHL
eukprot:3514426-Prorocentrum_lima.AAC.1